MNNLKSQIEELKKENTELIFIRDQYNAELTDLEKHFQAIKDENSDLKKQVELSGNMLQDKIARYDKMCDKLAKT